MPRAALDRRGAAALEFALIAPVMLTLIWGVFDVARALVAWEETYHAAEAIAQAAEKLSVTNATYPNSTQPLTALTASQMQDAMSSIYAEMPWLNLGNGTGAFTGSYAVTLSGVSFEPRCPANPLNFCLPQLPFVLWSSYLTQGFKPQLKSLTLKDASVLWRQCGNLLPVAQFPNDYTQLLVMIDPNKVSGGVKNINDIPQVVADVQFSYTPSFPLLRNFSYTFYASATFPAPLGGDDQAIVFDQKDSGANTVAVENCPGGTPYNG